MSAQSRAHRSRRRVSIQSEPRCGSANQDRNVSNRVRRTRRAPAMKLAELASLIRSKNAGPFVLTFTIIFPDDESYRRVKNSGVLSIARFAALFQCLPQQVQFLACDNARAL